jgi:hypothetical protein
MEDEVKDCEYMARNLIGFVERKLEPELMAKLTQHAVSCRDCSELVEGFAAIWHSADQVEVIEQSGSFWAELQSKLDVIDEQREKKPFMNRLMPVLQPVAALAVLVVAVLLGYNFGQIPVSPSVNESSEMSDLWSEYGLESFDRFPDGSLADIYFELDEGEGDGS